MCGPWGLEGCDPDLKMPLAQPIEFVVTGTPISVQASSKSKTRWKAIVAAAASSVLSAAHTLTTELICATIVYFYRQGGTDVDNILKPILDAMNGIVYVDDDQVVDIRAAKRDLAGNYSIQDVSPVLLDVLTTPGAGPADFVFVRVEETSGKDLP